PLHRIRAGVRARLIVSGSPDNLYPRTVRVEGLPWDDVAGGVLMRNGLTSLWYTLTPDVLRNGFVERFYAGPGFAPVHYEDGWKKRRVQDRTDRYTGAVRLADGGVVYPAPAVLDAPRVDPATVMDPMIPPPLDRLGPPLSPTLLKLWGPDADRLADRGPLGHDLRLPPEGDPARPRVLRDGPDGPWYLRFDGDDDRVPAAPGGNRPLNMPPGPLTVELRLRCRAAGRPQVIFDQWGDAMGIGLTGAGRLVIARLNRERTMDWLEGRQPLEPERWYTVHAVYDGRELKLYVDGEADGAPVASDGLRTDENMVLGGTSGILAVLAGMHERIGGHFAGDLARLRVLQRPLSAEEIRRAAGPRP
ncbi:MAG: LamG domain-containing protein, partial [Lentisphaerae bacterium]|nr:LamG domain-containing protein [Lentisphaerota bacterium]